jgi:hypothetical protein
MVILASEPDPIIQFELHFEILHPFCLSYMQNHENIVSSIPQGAPRKRILIPKTPRNKKMTTFKMRT